MPPAAVRVIVVVVCVAGVAGMIVSSALDHNGAALTFGLITAVAILCLMVASAVETGRPPTPPVPPVSDHEIEQKGARLEEDIAALVAAGADEGALRDLVRDAFALGRQRSGPP